MEIGKLCSLNAPLKVLFVCCEWNPKLWAHGGMKDKYLNIWSNIIKTYSDNIGLLGTHGLIVAEKSDKFRFYASVWDETSSTFVNEIDITDEKISTKNTRLEQ